MKYVTGLKRLAPITAIEKGWSGIAPTTASKIIDVEGEFYIRTIYLHNAGTSTATVTIYSGNPQEGGVEIFRTVLGVGEKLVLNEIKGFSATAGIYLASDTPGVFVVIGGEDYVI
jgi:hypothetical protein